MCTLKAKNNTHACLIDMYRTPQNHVVKCCNKHTIFRSHHSGGSCVWSCAYPCLSCNSETICGKWREWANHNVLSAGIVLRNIFRANFCQVDSVSYDDSILVFVGRRFPNDHYRGCIFRSSISIVWRSSRLYREYTSENKHNTFSWLLHKWRECYLLPTWAWKITCWCSTECSSHHFHPYDDWSILVKCWQVIFAAQVGNR